LNTEGTEDTEESRVSSGQNLVLSFK